jgi:chromosome segregation ATPase
MFNFKRIGSYLSVTVVAASLLTGSALADTTPPTTPPAAHAVTSNRADLKAAMDQIKGLRTQTTDIAAKLHQQTETNKDLLAKLHTKAVGDLPAQIKLLNDQIKQAIATNIKPLRDQVGPLEAQLKLARTNKDGAQVALLKAKLTRLRDQIKTEVTALQGQRDQLKALHAQLTTTRQQVKGVMDQVKPLWAQEKALYAKNQELRDAKAVAWKAFDAAKLAKDDAAMLTALNTVIQLKQQILANMTPILTLKQQVTAILQVAVGA